LKRHYKSNKLSLKFWVPFIGHFILFAIAYILLFFAGVFDNWPNNLNLASWDATMYESIKENGYFLGSNFKKSDTGFFPFFPLVWRWLNASPISISILNFSLFFIGFHWLIREFQTPKKIQRIVLSIPSIIFFIVPYTESFFFISSTMMLIGWKNKRHLLVIAGIIIASISRPSFLYFLPALLFCFIFYWKNNLIDKNIKRIIYSTLIGLSVGFILQLIIFKIMTGNAFVFFQNRQSNNSFALPAFPLTTWRGSKLLWLDGIALLVTLTTALTCLYYLVRSFNKLNLNINIHDNNSWAPTNQRIDTQIKKSVNSEPSKSFNKKTPLNFIILFSTGYVSVILVHILFFNIKDPSGPTSLLGLNRFVFTSPFFFLLVQHHWPTNYNEKQIKICFILILTLCLILLGAFAFSRYPEQLRPMLYIMFISLFWIYRHRWKNLWIGFYFFHIILQVICFNNFISGLWVG